MPQGLWVIAFPIENVSLELLYISSRKISGFLKIYSNDIDGVCRGNENDAVIFCYVLSGFRCCWRPGIVFQDEGERKKEKVSFNMFSKLLRATYFNQFYNEGDNYKKKTVS